MSHQAVGEIGVVPPAGQTGRQRHNVLNLSVRSVVRLFCYQTCEQDILKENEPILMPVSTSGPRGKDMKRLTFRGHEVKDQVRRDLEAWRRYYSLSLVSRTFSIVLY